MFNASANGIGAILFQVDNEDQLQAISSKSRVITGSA